LGFAIITVVTVSEILRTSGEAAIKKISTSTVEVTDEKRSRPAQKAKVQIILVRGANFKKLTEEELKNLSKAPQKTQAS